MSQLKALVDQLLTNVALGYAPEGYIADKALPELQVDSHTGLIGKYTNQHLKSQDTSMGGRAEARRVESVKYDTSLGYVVNENGLEDVVTPADLRNIPDPFQAESDKVMGLTHLMKAAKERKFISDVLSSSVITNGVTLSGTSQFSDYTNSSPIGVVKTARNAVKAACGFYPNRVIMSTRLAETLSYHPEILNNLGFNFEKAGALTYDDIKKFMKVDILHVGDVQVDTAAEGLTESMAELYGNDLVFYYAPTSAAKFQKSFGYYLTVRGEAGLQVYKAPVTNPPNSTSIIVKDDYGFKVTDAACAYLIQAAI